MKKVKKFYKRFKNAPIDVESFLQKYKRCDLNFCQSMCCHRSASIDFSEEKILRKMIKKYRTHFDKNPEFPEDPFEVYYAFGQKRIQSKTRYFYFGKQVEMPPRFKPKLCVFVDSEFKCSIQTLSSNLGEDPWYLKPSGCWLHPISLMRDNKMEICILQKEEYQPENRQIYASFAPFTHCGRTCEDGDLGYKVFKKELELLGKAMGRDLLAEIMDSVKK